MVAIAKELLGLTLVTNFDDKLTAGIITETEAYHQSERACHAYQGRRTKRTEYLFHEGGKAYVYLCYGIHHLFNITTGTEGEAAAVLVRAVEPIKGVSTMLERRKHKQVSSRLTAGPGVLTQALGISVKHTGVHLSQSNGIWLEAHPDGNNSQRIVSSTRIGVDYAEEDALLPWRFYLSDNKWVSKL